MKAQIFPDRDRELRPMGEQSIRWRLIQYLSSRLHRKSLGDEVLGALGGLAAQRIKGLSLGRAVLGALLPKRSSVIGKM